MNNMFSFGEFFFFFFPFGEFLSKLFLEDLTYKCLIKFYYCPKETPVIKLQNQSGSFPFFPCPFSSYFTLISFVLL